jgi:hypothetical protein
MGGQIQIHGIDIFVCRIIAEKITILLESLNALIECFAKLLYEANQFFLAEFLENGVKI